jgi:hypothetical protein
MINIYFVFTKGAKKTFSATADDWTDDKVQLVSLCVSKVPRLLYTFIWMYMSRVRSTWNDDTIMHTHIHTYTHAYIHALHEARHVCVPAYIHFQCVPTKMRLFSFVFVPFVECRRLG